MSISKIEVRLEADPVKVSETEIWEIDHILGRKDVKIMCNGIFVASNAAGSEPLDAAYEIMTEHLAAAFNKIKRNDITQI